MELKFSKWLEDYLPIENIANDNTLDNSYRKYLYHFKGQEYFKVKSFPNNNIWVLLSEGTHIAIKPYTGVKSSIQVILGFFITMNPWNNEGIVIWEEIN